MDHGTPLATPLPATARAPQMEFALEIRVRVGSPLEVGQIPAGRRRIIPLTGGTFEGPGLKGTVLPGGADWQLVRPDTVAEIDARYTLETDRGQLIYIRNSGIRHAPPEIMKRLIAGEAVDPNLVYFRTTPVFETAAPELQELTRHIYVATGERHPTEVVIRVFRIT
jgi:hypothetical protein